MNVLGYNIYYSWDLLGLYRQLFGQVGIPYSKVEANQAPTGVGEDGRPIEAWDGNTLEGVAFRDSRLKGGAFMMPLTLDGWQFPIEPLISVMRSKKTIETMVTGLLHPVIEEVAMEAWKVSIKGIFINDENDDYPHRDVARLPWLQEKRGALPVVNKLLSTFGIDYLCIKDIKADGIEGHQSMQWYVIEAISDSPVKLTLQEGTV